MRRVVAWMVAAIGALGLASSLSAHNNPSFREVLLLSVEVLAEPMSTGKGAHSEPFTLDLPKKTIELIWRIASENADGITFSIAKDGEVVAEGLTSGATSKLMRGGQLVVVDVQGAQQPFALEVYANVIDRSKQADS